MKKWLTVILLLILLAGAVSARAAGGQQITVRFYDESSGSYGGETATQRVDITLDGAALTPTEAPALVHYPAGSSNGRTLVPVRLIAEALEASVTWVPETRQVIILRGESTVVLTLGSAAALVDGQPEQLPDGIPAGVVKWEGKESTMVPLRFVSEQLGAQVDWDGERFTAVITSPGQEEPEPDPAPEEPEAGDMGSVTGIRFDSDAQTLVISADHALNYRLIDLGDRLAVDLLGAVYPEAGGGQLSVPVDSPAIEGVRCYQHGDDLGYGYPHTLRVVLDLAAGVTYAGNLSVSAGGGQVRVSVTALPETPEIPPADPGQITIAVDPGHGGDQPGAVYPNRQGENVQEKDLTLPIALKLADILEEMGYHVVLTRDTDRSVSLSERAQLANAAGADLFVSVHCNALTQTSYQGIFTYHYPGSTKGEALARQVQAGVAAATGGIDRGILSANFQVLRETTMPAVLVETGFMSNLDELALLCDGTYQQKLAQGIADGVAAYLEQQA